MSRSFVGKGLSMVHDDKHAIYLALTFDVKAQPVDTKSETPEAPEIKPGLALDPRSVSV
jgi:hypothetical protein